MIAASARLLGGASNCFVGVGLPNIVCNLAQRTVAPELQLVYESGVYGARPERLPLSIGDPTLATGSTAVTSMFELFAFYLQAGLIDVAFLGGAQIDRFGNLNTTVIGDYEHPKVRLPGSGGACEIAIHARQILVIMRQAQRSFVDRLDFRTSPGHSGDPAHDAARGWCGSGPTSVVTDLATYGFDEATGEMTLRTLHPGRHARRRPREHGVGSEDRRRSRRDAGADRRGAAADPRGARPRRGLHEVTAGPIEPLEPPVWYAPLRSPSWLVPVVREGAPTIVFCAEGWDDRAVGEAGRDLRLGLPVYLAEAVRFGTNARPFAGRLAMSGSEVWPGARGDRPQRRRCRRSRIDRPACARCRW